MPRHVWIIALALSISASCVIAGEDASGASHQYQALRYPAPPAQGTWAILDRDGANRQVEPYLSSLASGEFGTGVIVSPPFALSVDTIRFTICGHDGQGGGQEKNFIALVDARSGKTLEKAFAPGSDPMQERTWDVAKLKGREVRIEVHDGIAAGAYAWLGVGTIDAGPGLAIDFRKGMPDGWKVASLPEDERTELVEGGIPFLRRAATYTMIPRTGAIEIPCGFTAERLFFLGCTVARGKPLVSYGTIEIIYRDGDSDRYRLMVGYTLDGEGKLPSPSKTMHVHPSGDQFQFYLVIAPRSERIEKIQVARNPEQEHVPRITAITCQTQAASDNLVNLPESRPSAAEEAWIQSHTISPKSPNMEEIAAEIRRAHKMESDPR